MDLPKKTKAAVLFELKKPLEILEIDLPKELEVGQVLVEVYFSGICGSQLGEIDGNKGHDPWLPHLLGHEGSGKVLAIGAGVKHVAPNDFVVMHWRESEGIQSNTPKYMWQDKIINAGWVTTFNKYAVVSENRLTKIKNSDDIKTASLFGCAVTTGFGVIDNKAQIKIGENIVIFGSGGVGLNIIQAALIAGAKHVIAVDRYANRLKTAELCGATSLINAAMENPWKCISNILSGDKLDVFIDNTGNPNVIENGYSIVSPQGRVILVGVPTKGNNTSIYTLPLHFGKSIQGTHGGESIPQYDIQRYMSLLEFRGIKLESIISDIKGLDQVNTLIDSMRNGDSSGRCLIDLNS